MVISNQFRELENDHQFVKDKKANYAMRAEYFGKIKFCLTEKLKNNLYASKADKLKSINDSNK